MRHCLIVWVATLIMAESQLESSENMQPYTYSFYAPSSLNFNDIYTNNMATATEEEKKDIDDDKKEIEEELTTTTTEESYILNDGQSQYVEFHPEMTTVPPTIPPPKYILNSTFLKETTTKTTTTTEDPEDVIVRVVPIQKNLQRGVLDLLFPASRVKSFKNIFNSIRRMLSHTFRR